MKRAVTPGYGGICCSPVDEHKAIPVQVELARELRLARSPDVFPVLLGRVPRTFCRKMPWRMKKRERLVCAT